MLEFCGLVKYYDTKLAVDDLNLRVAAGEIYGFIGHNGAGKTTTLNCAAGILQPTAGDIRIDGTSVLQDPLAAKQKMAYIPDSPNLYEFLTGLSFLNFMGDVYRVSLKLQKERIADYAEIFELKDSLATPIRAYSHGMKQRLLIIAALIHEPKLLMLDEPFSGLDPTAGHRLKTIMREHCARGNAIFFSSHVLEVVEKLCDKVAIIQNGRLVLAGPTQEVVRDRDSLESVFLELEARLDH